jgi:putative hydrolase of the HAD superfamily
MLAAIGRCARADLRVAALTNNWPSEDRGDGMRELRDHFDAFFESGVLGLKPDPRIYLYACEQLRVRPPEAVFLDDIGGNLKAARALGMATIRVEEPGQALPSSLGCWGFRYSPRAY